MKRLYFGLLVAALWIVPAASQAATFSVNPIIVQLGKSNSSATVAVSNDSSQKLRLQITGYAWQQRPNGDMELQRTEDLVFFPELVTLDPGETRRIRVGSTVPQAGKEKTFRIFLEELPSLAAITSMGRRPQIMIRMKIGIPVFVSPLTQNSVSGVVQDASVQRGVLSFNVANTGNTHFNIQKVHVEGKNAAGGTVMSQDITGWYVLPGGYRHFTLRLTKDRCRSLESLDVKVRADSLNFAHPFGRISKDCGSG